MAIALWGALAPLAWGADAFRAEGSVELEDTVSAVAINADESLIGAAVGGDGQVVFVDRRSRAVLGSLVAGVGDSPRLLFSPLRDQLLVWGEEALELWNVNVTALKPGVPLPESNRVWRQDTPDSGPVTRAAFTQAPSAVLWSAGKGLYRRETAPGSATAQQPWLSDADEIAGFDVALGGGKVVTHAPDGKTLRLRTSPPGSVPIELKGHRFEVAGARFSPEGALLSLDRGRNLIDWQGQTQPKHIDFLSVLPEGAEPVALQPLSPGRVALALDRGGEHTLTVLDGAERTAMGALPVPERPRWAMSPTGRYVVTAADESLTVHAFSAPISPLDYVRRLREWGAMSVALSFARHLAPEAVTPAMQRQIEQELNRVPSESVLAELVERLREAVEAQDAAAIEEWAGQVLRVQPAHPEALAALAGLQSLRDRKLIAQAREHYDAGQYRTAIDLLANRIPETSQHAAAAQELIRQAEEKRQIQTTLVQARERMEAGLYEPAETLVNEALRRDPESREALLLQNEILNRSGGFVRENARLGMGALAMLGLAGLLLHRTRAVWLAWFRPLALDRDRAHKPPVEGLHAREAEAGRTGAEAFGARRPEDARGEDIRIQPGARPKLARALRLEEARRMLERTEQLLRLSRQADRFQEHTAWFLELEAELSTISRRLSDTHGDPDRALSRLQRILAELRNVKFKAPPRDPPANGAGEEPSYYELLQVGTGATLTEIKSAYHRLLKEYHPDRHNQSEFSWIKQESERMTRRIGEAYEVLSDAAKREQYDRELNRRRRPAHGA